MFFLKTNSVFGNWTSGVFSETRLRANSVTSSCLAVEGNRRSTTDKGTDNANGPNEICTIEIRSVQKEMSTQMKSFQEEL